VLDGQRADSLVAVAKGSVFVDLILKKIRVNCTNAHSMFPGEVRYFGRRLIRLEIPKDVQGDGWTDASEGMNLTGVGQLVIEIDCRRVLEEFAEAGASVCEPPAWGLNLKVIERGADFLGF
jgi:hypothetical protein